MRWTLRGARITYSPRSCIAVRVYCSSDSVSVPSRTTNAPLSCVRAATSISGTAYMGRSRELADSNRRDFVVLGNLVHHILTFGDLAKDGVDAVQMRLGRVTNEELAAAGVLPRVRHGQGAADVFVRVARRLALDRIPRPSRPDPALAGLGVGVAPLDHEVGDHAVELGPVVEAGVGELLEVRHRVRHLVGEQLHFDGAPGGLEHRFLVRHLESRVEVLVYLRDGLQADDGDGDVAAVQHELAGQLR